MKQGKRRGLTRIVLALILAGYYMAPVALAEDSVWVDSGETNISQGTIPWSYSEGGSATIDADRVTSTSSLRGACPQGSETDERLYPGGKLTASWEISGTKDDVGLGGLGDNAKTIGTIRWTSYKDVQGGNPRELVTKMTSYTLTDADRGRYIGTETTPTTQIGTPSVGTVLHLYDVSIASGGGSDGDSVVPGPVVSQSLEVAISVNGTSINPINDSTPIKLGRAYVAKLYSGENKSGKFGAGTDIDATVNYDFRWVLLGSSQQFGTSDGIASLGFDNNSLVIPATDDEARTNLDGPVCGGKKTPPIPINGDGMQGYKFHITYKHK